MDAIVIILGVLAGVVVSVLIARRRGKKRDVFPGGTKPGNWDNK